ncbi:GNAT family N-acetyltransferase [Sphingoaurantiacus capsulatus]|uniref:GNAT family N-acetyltransferase n=1 Tax=Sphingoaurantiacus capsulatus TaxID=1771310 RepID=A0ABV7X8W7_9SPHN
MTDSVQDTGPRTLKLSGGDVLLRPFATGDEAAVLGFAGALPEHDLLFLTRDITQAKVVAAWMRDVEDGTIVSLLALKGPKVVGTTAVVRDALSWSPHVGDIRVLVSPEMRGQGLGQILAQEAVATATAMGLEKLTVRMTVDQQAAIAVFESLGFRGEALLRDHVKDRAGNRHDLAILSHNVAEVGARLSAFGVGAS